MIIFTSFQSRPRLGHRYRHEGDHIDQTGYGERRYDFCLKGDHCMEVGKVLRVLKAHRDRQYLYRYATMPVERKAEAWTATEMGERANRVV